MSESEKSFDQAVQLAAAFVANGDVMHLQGTLRDQNAMHMLFDLIGTLHEVVEEAREAALRPPLAEP